MKLRTKRLTICPLGLAHLQSTHEYASDAENTRYMVYLPNETVEETAEFLARAEEEWVKEEPKFYECAILYEDKHIGAISLYPDENRTTAEFGWILHKDYWGRGIATEAAEALLAYAAENMGIHHFIAHCDSENVGSYRVMENLGMHRTACYGGRKNKSSAEERLELLYEIRVN